MTKSRKPPPQILRPSRVLDPELFKLARQDANYQRWLTAQLPDAVWAKIVELLGRHPLASNNQIADWVRDDPETKKLVAHLKRLTLAGKIGKLRK